MGPPPPSYSSAGAVVAGNSLDPSGNRGTGEQRSTSFFSSATANNHVAAQEQEMLNLYNAESTQDQTPSLAFNKPLQNVWGSPFTLPSLKSSIMSGGSSSSLPNAGSSSGLALGDSGNNSRPQLRLSSSSSLISQPPHLQAPNPIKPSSSSQSSASSTTIHLALNASTGLQFNNNNLSQPQMSSIISRPKSDALPPSFNPHISVNTSSSGNILNGLSSSGAQQQSSLLLNSDYYFDEFSNLKSGSTVESLTPFIRSSSSSSSNVTQFAGNSHGYTEQQHKQFVPNTSYANLLDNSQIGNVAQNAHDDLNIGQFSQSDSLQPDQIEEFIRLIQNRIRSREILVQRIQTDIAADRLLVSKLNTLLIQSRPVQAQMPPINQPVIRSNSMHVQSMPAPNPIVRANTMPEPLASTISYSQITKEHNNDVQSSSSLQSLASVEKKLVKHEELICRKWNKGECFKGSHCSYYHECLNCGGTHQRLKCPLLPSNSEKNEICIKWNNKECQWNEMCHRRHICCNCKGQHPAADCPLPPSNKPPAEIPTPNTDDSKSVASTVDNNEKNDEEVMCINWNEGRCRMGERCRRQHKCSICQSLEHPAIHCDYPGPAGTQKIEKVDEVCLNWNSGRCNLSKIQCKRRHVCAYCGSGNHMAVGCPNVPSPADLANVGIDYCWNWNAGACDDSLYPNENENVDVGGNCKRIHSCSECEKSGHSAINCQKQSVAGSETSSRALGNAKLSEICMNWNMNKCRLGDRCKRLHVCALCNSNTHRSNDCAASNKTPDVSRNTLSFTGEACLNWNHGKCKAGKRCRRQHVCSVCNSSEHIQVQCPAHRPSLITPKTL